MPHHYLLHKLKAHPKHRHLKKHLSHFSKTHPKTRSSAIFSNYPSHEEIRASMQGEGIIHRKKLHPLKFKI